MSRKLHKNPWGDPCRCPWFRPAHKEHLGAVKEAAKLDWLRERPDVQGDLRKRLLVHHEFPRYGEDIDPLLPWIMREYNKGHLALRQFTEDAIKNAEAAEEAYQKFIQAGFDPESVNGRELHNQAAVTMHVAKERMRAATNLRDTSNGMPVMTWAGDIARMLEDRKRRGQGIDLMQHTWYDLVEEANAWRQAEQEREEQERRMNNGQIVHRWDDGPHKGWTVRRLRDKDECDLEGELMGHCVGSYGGDVEDNRTNIFSLRDAKNHPHATMEIRPPGGLNPEDPTEWKIPPHAWDELPMKEFQGVPIEDIRNLHDLGGYNYHTHPAASVYPEFMRRAVEGGSAMPPLEGGEIAQTQGQSGLLHEDYSDMLNEFLEPHGLTSWKKWWDPFYEMEGPENFRELVGYNGDRGEKFGLGGYPNDEWGEREPDEYRNAVYEANERGLEWPELRVDSPNYYTILDSLVDPASERHYDYQTRDWEERRPWLGYNPEAGQYVLNHAEDANELDELAEALRTHIDESVPKDKGFVPTPDLEAIEDPRDRRQAIEQAEKDHYDQLGWTSDPFLQMLNHLGPQVLPDYQTFGPGTMVHQLHPEQQRLWDPEGLPYSVYPVTTDQIMNGGPFPNVFNPPQHPPGTFSKVASLYQRWVYSPASANVTLNDNGGNPLDVKYHTDLARELNEPNLVHGYAYPINGGWRLFDWENNPLKDAFIVAQVMRKLQAQRPRTDNDPWDPSYEEDWDRIHLGLPS